MFRASDPVGKDGVTLSKQRVVTDDRSVTNEVVIVDVTSVCDVEPSFWRLTLVNVLTSPSSAVVKVENKIPFSVISFVVGMVVIAVSLKEVVAGVDNVAAEEAAGVVLVVVVVVVGDVVVVVVVVVVGEVVVVVGEVVEVVVVVVVVEALEVGVAGVSGVSGVVSVIEAFAEVVVRGCEVVLILRCGTVD